ncbi:MAG: sugar ABC transporter ATP-binding protein [Pseudomonadota bacterium]
MATAIKIDSLRKVYGPTVALDGASHEFEAGQVHALVGKNGSGKSTMVKILNGAVQLTDGAVELFDQQVAFANPAEAMSAGVVTVYQELSLVPGLSVLENVLLGRMPSRRLLGLESINWAEARRQVTSLMEEIGLTLDIDRPVSRLSVGQQQMVEIAKAYSLQPRVLLLDEPTSALAAQEVEMLFALIRRLRDRGVTIIYISHRLAELFEIADSAVVLRDGLLVGSLDMATATNQDLIDLMFGDEAHVAIDRNQESERGAPVLEVRGLTRDGAFADIDFTLHRGEVLGIAGMLGAGRTELMRAIFGADPLDKGEIILDGAAIDKPNPHLMTKLGLGYTPENRKEEGLIQFHPIRANLCMAALDRIAHGHWIHRRRETPHVERQVTDLGIKIGHSEHAVSSLSGGNQQKVVIGNWLNIQPKVMFYDEPSRGVDVNAKRQIFQIIRDKASEGVAALFVSTELEELLDVCDRILVMRNGRLTAELDPLTATIKDLYSASMGTA